MKIRKATGKDIPALLPLWRDFCFHHEMLDPEHSQKVTNCEKEMAKMFKKQMSKTNVRIFVAEDGKGEHKELVGYIYGWIKENAPVYKIKKLGYVSNLYVRSEYRGVKVSTKLNDAMYKFFKKNKVKYAEVKVLSRNRQTVKIYENWGFEELHKVMRRKL